MRLPCRPEDVAAGHGCAAFPRGSAGFRHRAEARLRDWPTEAVERPCWRGRLPGPRAAYRASTRSALFHLAVNCCDVMKIAGHESVTFGQTASLAAPRGFPQPLS